MHRDLGVDYRDKTRVQQLFSQKINNVASILPDKVGTNHFLAPLEKSQDSTFY